MRSPQPYGPLPSKRQLAWHAREAYAFIHFSINTFTDKEWGYGDESPSVFNPTDFDADQIVRTVQDAGLKGLVLTCKHHDGFCLWPSKYTEHSVRTSPWKNGRGDVVREISQACRRWGLPFGIYLSPWDRNSRDYGRPEYLTYYRNQLGELLTEYGPIFEVWFDGANGGDGYYGGARETRKIDNRTYYDWANTIAIVRRLQPMACMFSDSGPDIRWIGNESGVAGDPCWAAIDAAGNFPGHANPDQLNRGNRPGTDWMPGEADVSIRPGWFYHASEDGAVKSVAELQHIYFELIGRGTNLILNLPPDRRGRIPDHDVRNLRDWNRLLAVTFANNLAQHAIVTASNTRGESAGKADARFAPVNVRNSKRDDYWATDDAITTPELVVEMPRAATFNVVRLREYLPLGQRVDAFALDFWQKDQWMPFADATSIGSQRLVKTDPITTSKVRLRITRAAVCPAISEVGLFQMPIA